MDLEEVPVDREQAVLRLVRQRDREPPENDEHADRESHQQKEGDWNLKQQEARYKENWRDF